MIQHIASHAQIRDTVLRMLDEREPPKTVCPSEVARGLAGSDEKVWRLLMQPVRRAVVELAGEGRVGVYRKGRLVDPQDFKGIYRIGRPDDGSGSR